MDPGWRRNERRGGLQCGASDFAGGIGKWIYQLTLLIPMSFTQRVFVPHLALPEFLQKSVVRFAQVLAMVQGKRGDRAARKFAASRAT